MTIHHERIRVAIHSVGPKTVVDRKLEEKFLWLELYEKC